MPKRLVFGIYNFPLTYSLQFWRYDSYEVIIKTKKVFHAILYRFGGKMLPSEISGSLEISIKISTFEFYAILGTFWSIFHISAKKAHMRPSIVSACNVNVSRVCLDTFANPRGPIWAPTSPISWPHMSIFAEVWKNAPKCAQNRLKFKS